MLTLLRVVFSNESPSVKEIHTHRVHSIASYNRQYLLAFVAKQLNKYYHRKELKSWKGSKHS